MVRKIGKLFKPEKNSFKKSEKTDRLLFSKSG